ncbi:MAG: helix-turn-helix domain-containing protein [Betaproteobacteria bacterium]
MKRWLAMERERDFYTVDEVATLFGVPVDEVVGWTRRGLPHSVKGGRWVFVKENVIEWARTYRLSADREGHP